jgi:hypothetical protein
LPRIGNGFDNEDADDCGLVNCSMGVGKFVFYVNIKGNIPLAILTGTWLAPSYKDTPDKK